METMDSSLVPHYVVAGILTYGARVLLVHRSPLKRWYPNVSDLPGGHVEPGEDSAMARCESYMRNLECGSPYRRLYPYTSS